MRISTDVHEKLRADAGLAPAKTAAQRTANGVANGGAHALPDIHALAAQHADEELPSVLRREHRELVRPE